MAAKTKPIEAKSSAPPQKPTRHRQAEELKRLQSELTTMHDFMLARDRRIARLEARATEAENGVRVLSRLLASAEVRLSVSHEDDIPF